MQDNAKQWRDIMYFAGVLYILFKILFQATSFSSSSFSSFSSSSPSSFSKFSSSSSSLVSLPSLPADNLKVKNVENEKV